jgi:hypothetical protein
MVDESAVEDLAEEIADVRDAGSDLCLEFDWHVLEPYHGRPPHLDNLVNKRNRPPVGFGYAPFGWRDGWNFAKDQMASLMLAFKPEAVLYGRDPHIHNGWGFLNDQRDPAVAAYNDTMGILREALEESGYRLEVLLIPETPGSNIQARGIRRGLEGGLARFVLPVGGVEWDEDEEEVDEEDEADDLEEAEEEVIAEMEENGELPQVNYHPAAQHVEKAMFWLDQSYAYPSDVPKRAMLRRARRQINKAIKLL